MHEMSLVESLRATLEEQARIHNFRQVKTIWLEVGPFANVEVESLRFCFDVVMQDSLAAGAQLDIHVPAGTGWCLHCMAEVTIAERLDPCPVCGNAPVIAQGGDSLRIQELEVE